MPPVKSKQNERKLTPEEEALLGEPELQPAQPAAVPAPRPRWKVVKDVRASYFGQIITLTAGELLEESSYDVQRLRDSGVELERP